MEDIGGHILGNMEAISSEGPLISRGGRGWQYPANRPHDVNVIISMISASYPASHCRG